MSAEPHPVHVRALGSVGAMDEAGWDAIIGPDASPFQTHGFLTALEDSGAVGGDTGWIPMPLIATVDGRDVGLATAYIKHHSMGEFVYDWAWADAAARSGLAYYPKVVIAAPFSPVADERLWVRPGLGPRQRAAIKRALLTAAVELARDAGCHSVHVLFCTAAEVAIAESIGFFARMGHQFHWDNPGYRDFEDYLSRFRSKRRNQIRRERRRVRERGFEVISHLGHDVSDALLEPALGFYQSTVDRYVWGRHYLNRRTFELLWERLRDNLQMVVAHHEGVPVAGALNVQKGKRRYGRYWGAAFDADALHFEVCSYASIDDAIQQGLEVFEAGVGGGAHKLGRGFLPTRTFSVHHCLDARLHLSFARFCHDERCHLEPQIDRLRESVFVR